MAADPGADRDPGGAAEGGVSIAHRHGAAVAVLRGEIDISNVDEIRRSLVEVDDIGTGLIIDLTPVGFMDSSAISLLHELAQRVRHRGQTVIVVCPPESPSRRMLELSGLSERAALLERVADALDRLSPAR